MTKTALRPVYFADNDWGPAAGIWLHYDVFIYEEGFRPELHGGVR